MSFDNLLKPTRYRWPKENDLPLREAKRSETAGPLTGDGLTRAVFIMDGFMLAGAALADQVVRKKIHRYDLVYPMLFCYRHAIEIGLKWLIVQYGPPFGIMPKYLNDTHNILKLWQDCLRVYQACGASADDKALKAVGRAVQQFHEWDQGEMTFRYATTKVGDVVRFEHSDIDVDNLKDVMSGIANFFNGSDGWLDSIANA